MDYFSGWCKSKRRLDGLTAVVTGSNGGIGLETALDFYLRGARVIMACRDVDKAETAKREMEQVEQQSAKGALVVESLDTASLQSVRQFASLLLARETQIHILVNNAGVMLHPEARTGDGFETHMATNHYGHALLTLMLLPRLVAGSARIVFVSSVAHIFYKIDWNDFDYKTTPYNAKKAYSWSKSANIIFARALAKKLQEHNISNVSTYSLHPGVIKTRIAQHASKTLLPGATWIYDKVLSVAVKSARCGAQTTIYCAVDDACANQSGLYYRDCGVRSPAKHCRGDAAADKLWDLTLAAVGAGDPFAFASAEGLADDERSVTTAQI